MRTLTRAILLGFSIAVFVAVGCVAGNKGLDAATEQHTKAAPQTQTGSGTQVGGGNNIKLDGGMIVGLAAIIVPCVVIGYLLSKGGLSLTRSATRAVARRFK